MDASEYQKKSQLLRFTPARRKDIIYHLGWLVKVSE